MSELYEIRATYDARTITMYQAYGDAIADAALDAQTFVAPFSFRRMSWIKPSFLWLMHRSQWAKKSNQTRILAVKVRRDAFDAALEMGVLTHPELRVYGTHDAWSEQFERAQVHIQWDPERDWQGRALDHYSIQVGLTRHVLEDFAATWIAGIEDVTPLVRKIRDARSGRDRRRILQSMERQRAYPVPDAVAHRLMMGRALPSLTP